MGPKSIIVQRTLYDIRDQKTYTIAKLPDGNCWMTQNLALGSTEGSMTLTSSDSNVSSSFVLPQAQATSDTTTSWGDAANTSNTPHLYATGNINYGNYYNWYAATAGTGLGTMSSASATNLTNATDSICPKGWRLPDGGESQNGSFSELDIAIGGTGANRTDVAQRDKLLASPYSFPYSGGYAYAGGSQQQGFAGLWWTRSATKSSGVAYDLRIQSANTVHPQHGNAVGWGFSVRCLADDSTPGALTVSPDTIDADTATTVDVSIPLSGDYNASISLGDTALTCSRTSTSPLAYSCNIPSTTSGTYTLTASVPSYGKNYTGTLTVEIPSLSNMCSNAPLTTSAGSPYFTFDGVDYIKLNTASSSTSGVNGSACYTKTSQGSATWANAASVCPTNTGVPTQAEFQSLVNAYGKDGTIYNTTGWSDYYWSSTANYFNTSTAYGLYVKSSNASVIDSLGRTTSYNVVCTVR